MTTPKLSRQSIRWVCVNGKYVDETSLSESKRLAIVRFIGESQVSWETYKNTGWRCIKVKLTIEEV